MPTAVPLAVVPTPVGTVTAAQMAMDVRAARTASSVNGAEGAHVNLLTRGGSPAMLLATAITTVPADGVSTEADLSMPTKVQSAVIAEHKTKR